MQADIGVTEQTDSRWRKAYGGLRMDQAKRLKSLEKENGRLKKLVADLSVDNQILKEVSSGNFQARRSGEERGLRRCFALEGWKVNPKGVERLWRQRRAEGPVQTAETQETVAP